MENAVERRTGLRLSIGLLALTAALAATACSFDGYVPKETPLDVSSIAGSGIVVELDQNLVTYLDCIETRCNQWYRINVMTPGRLRIRVHTQDAGNGRNVYVTLAGPNQQNLDTANGVSGERIDVEADAVVGPHFVLVQVIGGRVDFGLLATLQGSSGVRELDRGIDAQPIPVTVTSATTRSDCVVAAREMCAQDANPDECVAQNAIACTSSIDSRALANDLPPRSGMSESFPEIDGVGGTRAPVIKPITDR